MSISSSKSSPNLFSNRRRSVETCAILIFAVLYCFFCGQRGIFPLDQSIVFDGGYRVLSGQIPFRDFLTPHSLLLFYYQALVFLVLGVSYFAYLSAAAILNGIAALFAMRITARLFPSARTSIILSGLVTAIWFFPPFGTPFGEHGAFLCGLIGIDLLLSALLNADELNSFGNKHQFVASGLALGLAFFCKQNVTVFLLPFFVLTPFIFWAPEWRQALRGLSAILQGLSAALCAVLLLVLVQGNVSNFFRYYLELPFSTGLSRLENSILFELGNSTLSVGAAFLVILLVALISFRRRLSRLFFHLCERRSQYRSESLAAWLSLCILVVSHLMRKSMLNSMAISDLYIGVLIGMVWALAVEGVIAKASALIKYGLGLLVAAVVAFGLHYSWNRVAQESVAYADFGEGMNLQRLEWLRWGSPTMIREGNFTSKDPGISVSAGDIARLIEFLSGRDQNFLVFPDFTFLYGILQKPSPQPLVFFHAGLTYPKNYDSSLDNWIVDSLIRNQISLVILEETSFLGTDSRLNDFPLLKRFMAANFKEEAHFGLFKVYSLRTIEEEIGEADQE